MATPKEEKILDNIMTALKCSRKEAEDVMKWDKVIDKGGKTPYDLDPEKDKIARKYASTGTRKVPTTYDFSKRERKANPTKSGIISEIAEFLIEKSEFQTENVEITNKERQISFKIGEETYELTLVQKRKPKN